MSNFGICKCCMLNPTKKKFRVQTQQQSKSDVINIAKNATNIVPNSSIIASELLEKQCRKKSYGLPKMLIKKSTNHKLSNGCDGLYSSMLIPRISMPVKTNGDITFLTDDRKSSQSNEIKPSTSQKNGVNIELEKFVNTVHLNENISCEKPTCMNSSQNGNASVSYSVNSHSQEKSVKKHKSPSICSSVEKKSKNQKPKQTSSEEYATIFKPTLNSALRPPDGIVNKHVDRYFEKSYSRCHTNEGAKKRKCNYEPETDKKEMSSISKSTEEGSTKQVKVQNTSEVDRYGNIFTNLETFASHAAMETTSAGSYQKILRIKENERINGSYSAFTHFVPFDPSRLKVIGNASPKSAPSDIFQLPEFKEALSRVTKNHRIESPSEQKPVLLSNEANRKVDHVFSMKANNFILIKDFGLMISVNDVQTLCYPHLINDLVVDFYFCLIVDRFKKCSNYPSVFAFSTYHFSRLLRAFADPKSTIETYAGAFDNEIILFPVYLHAHWSLAAAIVKEREIRYYNSLGTCDEIIAKILMSFVCAHVLPNNCNEQWKFHHVRDLPLQSNRYDCGVFACQYAEHVSRYAPLTFDQSSMLYFRRKMAFELLIGRLL